jgi:polyhydroxyalkanoate synthesis regulator phasin
MKKRNFFSKTTICLLAIGMSIVLFAGCQSNSGTSKTASNTTQNSQKPSADQMKKRIQDSVQPLVTAGTITQAQGDKIVTAYTTRPAEDGQNNKTPDQKQNNQQGNTQNKQRNNPLSKLVTDGTITQAQADAVTQKMKENSTHKNNGQSSN